MQAAEEEEEEERFPGHLVLGLTFRKAAELRAIGDDALTTVADAEALCMVKKAATNSTLDDSSYQHIIQRCCLDRPGTTWTPNGQPPDDCACPAGQTWNPNAQPPACQTQIADAGTTDTPVSEDAAAGSGQLEAGQCSPPMVWDTTDVKCVKTYLGTNTFCTQACSGAFCTQTDCTTAPVIFIVDAAGNVAIPTSPSVGGLTSNMTTSHNGDSFAIVVTSQFATLNYSTTETYNGTVMGDTVQGTFSSSGEETGTTSSQVGNFAATLVTPSVDGGT